MRALYGTTGEPPGMACANAEKSLVVTVKHLLNFCVRTTARNNAGFGQPSHLADVAGYSNCCRVLSPGRIPSTIFTGYDQMDLFSWPPVIVDRHRTRTIVDFICQAPRFPVSAFGFPLSASAPHLDLQKHQRATKTVSGLGGPSQLPRNDCYAAGGLTDTLPRPDTSRLGPTRCGPICG